MGMDLQEYYISTEWDVMLGKFTNYLEECVYFSWWKYVFSNISLVILDKNIESIEYFDIW